uniref:Putative secreted protein n=1 Tax=Anopheles triannulatus TaxID=58253 RepID=A0A2M4B3I2_9DIPT
MKFSSSSRHPTHVVVVVVVWGRTLLSDRLVTAFHMCVWVEQSVQGVLRWRESQKVKREKKRKTKTLSTTTLHRARMTTARRGSARNA